MLLRSSKTLVVVPDKDGVICHDFLTKVSVLCEIETLRWLTCFSTWTDPEIIAEKNPDVEKNDLLQQFSDLLEIGLLQKKGSKAAHRQRHFRESWKFGLSAAILHFTCTDSVFISLADSASRQVEKLRKVPPPELYKKSCNSKASTHLNVEPGISDLLRLMALRRTNRTAQNTSIDQDKLFECLFAGLGITAFTKTVAGTLPLKMTPSGGARNPFEAYVMVKNVTGMNPGFYHFSASECALTPVENSTKNFTAAEYLAGQDWANDMPAIIFLVAMFERTMWKYQDDNAYRVVLIEAGHIAQNMMLAATAHGLTGCPTAALGHSQICENLGFDGILQNPIYAVTLSKALPNSDIIFRNDKLPLPLQQSLNHSNTKYFPTKKRLPQRSLKEFASI